MLRSVLCIIKNPVYYIYMCAMFGIRFKHILRLHLKKVHVD